MSQFIIKILNFFYYLLSYPKRSNVKIDDFFYQLDKIKNWNLIYGSKGFISYQLVVPEKNSYFTIQKILKTLVDNKCFSFVSVIKFLGRKDGFNSFGIKGFTLVFDFPLYKNIYSVLKKINKIVADNNGSIYLCKDSFLSNADFKKMNSGFQSKEFRSIRRIKKKFFNSEQSKRLKI